MNEKILAALVFDKTQILFLKPEIFLLSSIVIVLLLGLFYKGKVEHLLYYLTQISLLITAVLSWQLLDAGTQLIFSNSFVLDYFSATLKIAICLVSTAVLLYSRYYLLVHKLLRFEYFVLFLFAVFGMMVLASGYSLITIYLGLEILTISFYTLIAFATTRANAIEAALKFFVLAAISSAVLLYGISMIYGISASINIAEIASFSANAEALSRRELLVLNFGLVFIVIGIAFKFGAVPFHMWVPDVYQGAPTSVTMFLATIPKIAALILLVRLLVDALGGLVNYWNDMMLFLALASIILGSLVAIRQTNIKRLFAYSTISHIGFILLGFATGVFASYAAAIFYILTYVITILLAFGLIIAFNREGFEADNISDYEGLAKTHPLYALMILIVLFSMTGIPPLIGFYAKFFILQETVAQGYIKSAIVAVIFAVISAYYYLNICRIMYFQPNTKPLVLSANIDVRLLLIINILLVLAISLLPNQLIALSQSLLSL